jgi:hypothetical protein
MAGEQLDLSSEPFGEDRSGTSAWVKASGPRQSRKFVGVNFACCDVYARVYVNPSNTAYEGKCPRCAKVLTLKIGPGGTNSRFFHCLLSQTAISRTILRPCHGSTSRVDRFALLTKCTQHDRL